MQNLRNISFKWLGNSVPCPEVKLKHQNYTFYTECELSNIKYEVGFGVRINIDNIKYTAVIHFFYEVPGYLPPARKFFVAVELFYKPKDLITFLAKPVELDPDIEVVKKDKVILIHVPVFAIKSKCLLVYGLHDEEPTELLQEFGNQTEDTIYVCRYIASLKNNLYYLTGAVIHEINCDKNKCNKSEVIIIDDDENSPNKCPTVEKYQVTHIENDNNIKVKLKRQVTSPKKVDNKKQLSGNNKNPIPVSSPSELMKNLTISQDRSKKLLQEKINSIEAVSSKENIISKQMPVVLLQKIDSNSPEIIKNIKTEIKSPLKTNMPLTPRSSKQSSKKSYSEFFETSENCSKTIDDHEVTTLKRKPRTRNITKEIRNVDIKEDNSSEDEYRVQKKTNSVRKKRSTVLSEEITPIKLSRITTPRSSRQNKSVMTPTIEGREKPIVFCDTPMSRARMGLSAYAVPSEIPCREKEYSNIYTFVTGRLRDHSSGCMYISGVPGTGKTMTVCKVMSDLSNEKTLSDFAFLQLNALALTEPRQIYVEIVKKLLNKKLHWEASLKEIEKFFKAKKKKIPHILLVDELDKLCNRKQDVVYNLLDLPFHSVTPLIVITIANTMDLPERILSNKVNSRLGLIRLTFKPYQYKDLVKIVTERLAKDAVFKNEALELIARKVAAVSGDARRALAMCSRATEIAEEENKELVTMGIVDRVVTEMSSSSKVKAIQCCSKLEKFILTSIANEVTRTGNEEVLFLNMIQNLEQLCLLEGFKLPATELCLKSCHNLGSFRLLITQHGRTDINMVLMLNISTDDIHYALRN